ncbi:hypothetical protein [Agromyces sp. GXS1127]|uniref:hypothetical protein n=1 Tax=Agromyces sp. GXS1127 TaxID=3424181 RepID=UPI003D3108F7
MSAIESHEPGDDRLRVAAPPATAAPAPPVGRPLGSASLTIGVLTVAIAFATPLRETLASGILAALALFGSTLGLIARGRARHVSGRTPTAATAGIWLGIGALAIVGISVLPALLMPAGGGG